MRNIIATLQIAFLASTVSAQTLRKPDNGLKSSQRILAPLIKLPVQNEELQDPLTSESGFPAAISSGSKYFQYIHVPAKDHYEHGHKRGNEHHFIERHEKGHPHAGEFKTKVRWGDKHGGYGEHYWDYNHAGHDEHDGGEESRPQAQYTNYQPSQQESKPIPQKAAHNAQPTESYDFGNFNSGNFGRQQRQVKAVKIDRDSVARQQRSPAASAKDDVEFINDGSKAAILSGRTGRHGGNYRREPRVERIERGKRERDDYEEAAEYDGYEE